MGGLAAGVPMSERPRLENKIALVTGAGNGIGKGCALMFARHGAQVIACDIDTSAARSTANEADGRGWTIDVAAPHDLTREDDVAALMDEIAERHGRIDILVNSAATAVFKWLEDMSYEEWRKTLAGELDTVFLVCRAAWPLLKTGGASSIINFASASAYGALNGSPAIAHTVGKGGVLAMTRQLAMEGAPHGIRANTISPGLIHTAATATAVEIPAYKESVLAKAMIKRIGKPEDIAWCATYLASDEASFVTGADFSIDGGATAW